MRGIGSVATRFTVRFRIDFSKIFKQVGGVLLLAAPITRIIDAAYINLDGSLTKFDRELTERGLVNSASVQGDAASFFDVNVDPDDKSGDTLIVATNNAYTYDEICKLETSGFCTKEVVVTMRVQTASQICALATSKVKVNIRALTTKATVTTSTTLLTTTNKKLTTQATGLKPTNTSTTTTTTTTTGTNTTTQATCDMLAAKEDCRGYGAFVPQYVLFSYTFSFI